MSHAKGRLIAWGRWLHGSRINCHPSVTVIWRVMHEGAGASCGGGPGDGGVGELVDRIGKRMQYDTRCLETHRLIGLMGPEKMATIYATFAGPSLRDIPRSGRAAAALLSITERAYRLRMDEIYDWMEGRTFRRTALDVAT